MPQVKDIIDQYIKSAAALGMSPQDYAASEGNDISGACSALQSIAYLASREIQAQEPDDVRNLIASMRALNAFISGEIDEMEQALGESDTTEAVEDEPAEMVEEPEEVKSLPNLTYIKSLHPDKADQFFRDVIAVKSIGRDEISGYAALWGDPARVDVEGEYFTKQSDFWLDRLGQRRPLTWDHALDKKTAGDPLVGTIEEMGADDIGLWYKAQLDRGYKYRKAIDQLINQKSIGTSSDSAPQYVIRIPTGKSTWLKRWPMFAAALTTTPCEPRQIGQVDYYKSIGIELPQLTDAEALHEAARAWDVKAANLYRRERELKLLTGV